MTTRVIFSGATGKVGQQVIPALARASEFRLVGALARRRVGEDVGVVIGLGEPIGVPLSDSIEGLLASNEADLLIDFSTPAAAAKNCLAAVQAGLAAIIGTTAVDQDALRRIEEAATAVGVGVFLAPHLTIAGQLMLRCSSLIRPYFGDVEIVEAHSNTKLDAPSGTALETARLLNATATLPPSEDHTKFGLPDSRGTLVGNVRIHSIRNPSVYSHQEVIFSLPGQQLRICFDQYSTEPLVEPILKAARLVLSRKGLVRELPGLFDPD